MLQQTLTEMSEISVGITTGCDSLVRLEHMDTLPRHILLREVAQHGPRGFASTHRHGKLTAIRNCLSRFFCDELCGFECDGVGIGIDFDVHQAASLATAGDFSSPGLLQPAGGVTRSTSSGPHVPGAY